jgi:hypothetical protein
MPWAHHTYERIRRYHTKLLEYINEQKHRDIELMVKETLILAEILKREFTKRQLKIIEMIFTLSYGFGKEWALIPKMQDFELAGISKLVIRKELDQLVAAGVLGWKQEEKLFKINDPREWKGIPYHSGYNDDRSKELFFLNLKHSGIEVEPLMKEMETGE